MKVRVRVKGIGKGTDKGGNKKTDKGKHKHTHQPPSTHLWAVSGLTNPPFLLPSLATSNAPLT